MDVTKSTIMNEINEIVNKGSIGTTYSYDAFIKVGRTGLVYRSPKLVSMDILRDYVTNFTDKTIVKLMMPGGTFISDIQPYKDSLELIIRRQPTFNVSGSTDNSRHSLIETFTATLTSDKDYRVNDRVSLNKETVDLANLIEVEFDCISKTAEELNMIQVGGVPRNVTGEQVIKACFTNEACQAGNDKNITVKGVDMIPASNQEVRDHIVLPQGLKLVDLPNYIQKKCGGIYSTGMGYYLQERYWYIYPAYDFTRINNTERVITFIHVNPEAIPRSEKSFRYNNKQIVALATGRVDLVDNTDTNHRNKGNAISYTSAKSMLHCMVTPGGNKATADRAASNTEAKTAERFDGKTFMPVSNNPITDNAMAEMSKMAARNTANLLLTWDYSEPTAILPGTMARVYYMNNGKVVDAVGVITAVQHYIHMTGTGMSSTTYATSSAITINIDPSKAMKAELGNKTKTKSKPAYTSGSKTTSKSNAKPSNVKKETKREVAISVEELKKRTAGVYMQKEAIWNNSKIPLEMKQRVIKELDKQHALDIQRAGLFKPEKTVVKKAK